MSRTGPVSLASLVVALLALVAAAGGGAWAAGHIGRNQVVTSSIHNGAVTAPKIRAGAVSGRAVKDHSLTRADLASGAGPTSGKSAMIATYTDIGTSAGNYETFAPTGPSSVGTTSIGLAPTDLQFADLHVRTYGQDSGQSVTVALYSGAIGVAHTLISCTVDTSSGTCSSNATATITAGETFAISTLTGPGGSAGGFVSVSYTSKVLSP